MTRLLSRAGYRVTFLLFAFEDGWAWSHDEAAADALREEWDEVVIVHAGEQVGRPPARGSCHELDEWWDAGLEAAILNISARRCFDVVVVHNVWLSKAFDFVHPASVKVIETHDIFHKREAAFAAIGAAPSFFSIGRDAEMFGLSRADILVTIQKREAEELLAASTARVVNVPFYDADLEHDAPGARHRDARTVSFGMLASANPFNVHGAAALVAAVEDVVAKTYAPIELAIAGDVGCGLHSRMPIRCPGRVPNERDFYDTVDYAIAPVFAGTGFKIKTADALALGTPLLAASHAAEGTTLERGAVFATPAEMAARMAEIALSRPDPRIAQRATLRARDALRATAETGAANFLRAVARRKAVLVVDLHDACIEASALKLQSWLGMARILAARRTLLIVPDAVRTTIESYLPPGVRACSLAEYEAAAGRFPNRIVIDATAAGGRAVSDYRDGRWTFDDADCELSEPLAEFPYLHANIAWEPAAVRLRAAWLAANAQPRRAIAPGLLIFRPGRSICFATQGDPRQPSRAITYVDSDDHSAISSALMHLLVSPSGMSVVVSGSARPAVRRAALQVCAIAGVRYRGLADAAAMAPTNLPARIPDDAAARTQSVAAMFTAKTEEPPCPRP